MDLWAVGGFLWLASWALGVVLAACWIVLPFALIGTKPLLREFMAEVRKTNALLAQRQPQGSEWLL